MKKKIKIEGMHCEHCAKRVENVLKNINGVSSVKINLSKKEVILQSDELISNLLLKEKIEELDYRVKEIKEV